MKTRNKLKLYVFTDFCPDYTCGLAFALANDEVEARNQIAAQHGWHPADWGNIHILPLNQPCAFSVSGGG